MIGGLYALGAWAIIYPGVLISKISSPVGAESIINDMVASQLLQIIVLVELV